MKLACRFVSIFAVAIFAFGCGKSSVEKLNSDQKAEALQTFESVGRVQATSKEVHRKKSSEVKTLELESGTNPSQPTLDTKDTEPVVGETPSTESIPPQDEEVGKMVSQFDLCKVDLTFSKEPTDINDFLNSSFELKVSGEQCPVSLSNAFTMETKDNVSNVTCSMDFKALTDEFKKLNDIDVGSIKFSQKTEMKDKQTVEVSGDLSGSFHSQKTGDISFTGTLSGNGNPEKGESRTEAITKFKFPKYDAELKQISDIKGEQNTSETFLNGEKLTDEEVKKFLKDFEFDQGESQKQTHAKR